MKTLNIRTLLLVASVFTMGCAFASEPVSTNTDVTTRQASLERTLDKALNRHLSFPLLEKGDMLGEVMVSFVIDKEGKVEVVSCTSENERLRAYVLRKLARIDIGENPDGIWKTTYLKINFHPEKA